MSSELRRILRLIAAAAAVVATLAASADTSGCLEADARGVARTSPSYPLPAALSGRVALLQNVLGITQAIPIRYVPDAGVGRAVASCSAPGSVGTPARIEIDADAILSANARAPMTVDVVLAHELSHVLQFSADTRFITSLCAGTLGDVKAYELLADFGAGYALYKTGRRNAQLEFANAVGALGDYEFSSPLHHGTVSERLNAFNMGQACAYFGRPLRMDALLRNKETFLRYLAGANEHTLQSHFTNYADYARHTLDEVYK